MEFQVQGSVLVDGEWVSRPADVYQIMVGNQQQRNTEMRESASKRSTELPDLGILSKTVVQTPSSKLILPGNVRHRDLNDLVFIGEDSIQLKEIRDYGHLRHIATKSDFTGKILAASVFGDPRKIHVNTAEHSPLLKRASIHRARRSTTGEEEEEASLPPDVIVLTLSSRTLMFLWPSPSQAGPITFRQKTVRLPAGSSRFDRPGPILAVDPKGRAIAVAAYEGRFMLYKTKAMDQWREDTRAGHDEPPILDEALILIEGRIMHMEFLSSGNRDDSHIVLAFILVHEGKTKVACYDWDFRNGLDDGSVRRDRSVLDYEDRNPSLLIPLSRSADFLLVCDRHIALYKSVLSGPPTRVPTLIQSHILAPLRPGTGKGAPRWVQWNRAPRNPDFAKEAFYVAREDGVVVYVERSTADTLEVVEAGGWPYPIDTAFACLNIDNSEFAQSYPDVLISGGAGGDGHLCRVGAWPKEYAFAVPPSERNTFASITSIPNWAPLTDISVTRLPGLRLPYERDRYSIFVANGESPHGEVSELRFGLKAVVDDSFGGMKGCTGLWIVDYGSGTLKYEDEETRQHYVTFIVTLPPETILIRASRTQLEGTTNRDELGSIWDGDSVWEKVQLPNEDEPNEDQIVRDEETISACAWSEQYAIQITRNEARILRRPALSGVDSTSFSSSLLRAATRPGFPFIAAAFRDGNRTLLEIICISADGTFVKNATNNAQFNLPCDPTCIELLVLDGSPHVFVGTIDSQICLFKVDQVGSLTQVYGTRLEDDESADVRMVCESVTVLMSGQQLQLICGTRAGFLVSLVLELKETDYNLVSTSLTRMGTTAVQITPSAADSTTALVACGPDFCRIRCTTGHNVSIEIDPIWLVDPQNPAYTQLPLTALDQLPLSSETQNSSRDLGGFMLAVSGEQMVFAQLDYDVRWSNREIPPLLPEDGKIIPRNLATETTPKKMMYLEEVSASLHKMAVATIRIKEERSPPNGYRAMHSSIRLISLHEEATGEEVEIKQEDEPATTPKNLITAEFPLKHYERVYSMVEWTHVDERGSRKHSLIVGTGIIKGPGVESGRRLLLKISKSGISLQKDSRYSGGPVRCIAVYDNEQIVTIIGKTLSLDKYDPSDGKWVSQGTRELPSTGVHMTVSSKFIYISTADDSHICYKVVPLDVPRTVDNGRQIFIEFNQILTDSRQRHSAHHLIYNIPSTTSQHLTSTDASASQPSTPQTDTIVLLTDKTCSVTALLHSSTPSSKSTAPTLFEACLPRSVIRIHQGDIRPPWRRPCISPSVPFSGIPGILADDLLGGCSDGTIYNFSILTQAARRLLRLTQNLIDAKKSRDVLLQYSTIKVSGGDIFHFLQHGDVQEEQEGKIKARDVDPRVQERGEAAPRFKYVDGDSLKRWLDGDGNWERLVRDQCEGDVERLFGEYVARVREEGRERMRPAGSMFEWVARWMGDVLMPLL